MALGMQPQASGRLGLVLLTGKGWSAKAAVPFPSSLEARNAADM